MSLESQLVGLGDTVGHRSVYYRGADNSRPGDLVALRTTKMAYPYLLRGILVTLWWFGLLRDID